MVVHVQRGAPCMAHKLRKSVLQVALPRKGDRMRTEEENEDMDGDNADDAADDEGLHVFIMSSTIWREGRPVCNTFRCMPAASGQVRGKTASWLS